MTQALLGKMHRAMSLIKKNWPVQILFQDTLNFTSKDDK